MNKFKDAIEDKSRDYCTNDRRDFGHERDIRHFEAGAEFVLKALEECIEQRNVWCQDYYGVLTDRYKAAMEVENRALLEILARRT